MTLDTSRGRLGRPKRRNERGVSAVVVALLMTAIMAAGALGLDISKLVFERQQVRAAVDAAAQIGAARLSPNPLGTSGAATLVSDMQKAAVANYGSSTYGPGLTTGDVAVTFYCVVANTSGSSATASPNTAQIPSTCLPNPAPVNYTNTKCSATSCAIPCFPLTQPAAVCNAVKVSATKRVQFVLAPAIGIGNGSATAATVSCQGSCGGDAPPNPMDVVLMADRTPSMNSTELDAMRTGIKNMLGSMNQVQQYVAFGAIGISANSSPSATGATKIKSTAASDDAFTETTNSTKVGYASYTGTSYGGKTSWSSQEKLWHFKGTWIPIKYTNNYQKTVSGVTQIDDTTELGSAVAGLATSTTGTYPSPWHAKASTYSSANCQNYDWKNYKKCDKYGQPVTGDEILSNTQLASALKAAVRYSLTTDPASLNLPDRTQYGTPKKVVIFETDGSPYEVFNSSASALSLTTDEDIGATNDSDPYNNRPQLACDNFMSVATAAKNDPKKPILIMIAVGDAAQSATTCGNKTVAQMLASAASNRANGTPSDAPVSGCDSTANRTAENADGDNFYCAADANELKSVFTAAMGNITGGTKFMAIDGVGD